MVMANEELIKEIMQLPLEQRMELLDTITHNVRKKVQLREQRISAVSHLRGVARFNGTPPTDEEIKEDYTRYLTEKYS
jgi:hypothetical protein